MSKVVTVNVSAITLALLAVLQNDPTLRTLLPGGAWFAEAPPGTTRFVILSLVAAQNVGIFGGTGFKDCVYLVEARALTTAGADVEAAYDRITALLTDTELTIAGHGVMLAQFEEDLELVEVDETDAAIRWNRCGGHLHLMLAPATAAPLTT